MSLGLIIGGLLIAGLVAGLVFDLTWLVVVAGLGLCSFSYGMWKAYRADKARGFPGS